jgi:hypothetical protein
LISCGEVSRCKLGRAQRLERQLMTQFQAEIPHPLAHDTPCLLSTSGVTTPAIRILLFVFISQSRFKRAAMQVEGRHIRRSEGTLWEIGKARVHRQRLHA